MFVGHFMIDNTNINSHLEEIIYFFNLRNCWCLLEIALIWVFWQTKCVFWVKFTNIYWKMFLNVSYHRKIKISHQYLLIMSYWLLIMSYFHIHVFSLKMKVTCGNFEWLLSTEDSNNYKSIFVIFVYGITIYWR